MAHGHPRLANPYCRHARHALPALILHNMCPLSHATATTGRRLSTLHGASRKGYRPVRRFNNPKSVGSVPEAATASIHLCVCGGGGGGRLSQTRGVSSSPSDTHKVPVSHSARLPMVAGMVPPYRPDSSLHGEHIGTRVKKGQAKLQGSAPGVYSAIAARDDAPTVGTGHTGVATQSTS